MKTRIPISLFLFIVCNLTIYAQWNEQSNNFTNGHLGIGSNANTNSLYIYGSNSQNLLKVENSRDSDAGIEFESNLANFKIGAGIGNGTNSFTIYDLNGREVKKLVRSEQVSGNHSLTWNGTNDQGKLVSAGVYLYQIQSGEFVQTKKMVLMK